MSDSGATAPRPRGEHTAPGTRSDAAPQGPGQSAAQGPAEGSVRGAVRGPARAQGQPRAAAGRPRQAPGPDDATAQAAAGQAPQAPGAQGPGGQVPVARAPGGQARAGRAPHGQAAGAPRPVSQERRAARRTGGLVTVALGGLTAAPPLAIDMYLPALPEVTDHLSASASTVQLTLTACMVGLALGQLVAGPLSDRWGRRRPLLAGLLVYIAATALCALAPTVELLVAFRLVQGLAGAAGVVIARAVVRDLYDGEAMARFFATLMLISGVAPVVAPLVGGQVLRVTDWRGVFVVLAALGVPLLVLVWTRLPETLPPAERHTGGVTHTLRSMGALLRDVPFAGYVLAGGFGYAILFAYIAAAPFVIQELHGASAQTFSLLFGVNSVGLVLAGQINGRLLVGRVRLESVLVGGLLAMLAAGGALLALSLGAFGDTGLVPVACVLFVMTSATGLTLPNAQSLALLRTRHSAGTASALIGTASFLIGGIATPLVGVAGEHTAVPMAVVQMTAALVALGCFMGMCRPWNGRASVEGVES